MPILKCKMCGGDIIFTGENTVGRCDCCGSATTLPAIGEERLTNLFNRANSLRMRGEFNRAATTYERILAENEASAEAHWGIVLCHYGIEYVEDPDSHHRVPTCRLAQRDAILQHEDYLAAMRYADPVAGELYQKEAVYIDAVQRNIQMLARSERPYDIFISCKELTDSGERTKASVLAQDLYAQLSKEGYRVFFSRITLEDKLGQQYEPYIFAALNSARVMLVIGTEPEHFTSPWVRNEWSRFLSLQKEHPDRRLIPCYRDMDPYDLPDELSLFQSQDMDRIGFEQDLVRGLEKLLRKDAKAGLGTDHPADVSALLRRGQLLLEDHDWEAATIAFDKALDFFPECADAYIGRLCAETKSSSSEKIVSSYKFGMNYETDPIKALVVWIPLNSRTDYAKAMRFADNETRDKLEQCCQEVTEVVETYKMQKKEEMSDVISRMQSQIVRCVQDIDKATKHLHDSEATLKLLRQERDKLPLRDKGAIADSGVPDHLSAGINAFLIVVLSALAMNSIGLAQIGLGVGVIIAVIYYFIRVASVNQKFEELAGRISTKKREIDETVKSIRKTEAQRDALMNQLEPLQKQCAEFVSLMSRR